MKYMTTLDAFPSIDELRDACIAAVRSKALRIETYIDLVRNYESWKPYNKETLDCLNIIFQLLLQCKKILITIYTLM